METVFVFEHKETGSIVATSLGDAHRYEKDDDYNHIGTLHPAAYIEHILNNNKSLIDDMKDI